MGSEVIFGVNQSMAECVVKLIDDRLFETGERFFIHLASSTTHSFINIDPNYSSVCVYISYAEDDSKPLPCCSELPLMNVAGEGGL